MPDSSNNPIGGNGSGSGDPVMEFGRPRAAKPAGTGAAARYVTGLRLWARHTFAREQVISGLKSLLWVGPLTVLIWVYAEREQVTPLPDVTIPIEVTINDPSRVVTLLKPADSLITASLSGPKSQVEAVHSSLTTQTAPVQIEVDRNLGTGPQRIQAVRVGNDPRFASHGVTVSACQPAWLDVFVDPIVEQDIPVKAPANLPAVAAASFDPPTVRIRGPESVLRKATEAPGGLAAVAMLAGLPELSDPSRQGVTIDDVKLSLPFDGKAGKNVSLVSTTPVRAKLDLKASKERVLQFVPVAVASTGDVWDDYKIVYDTTVKDVTIVGPEQIIDQMGDAAFKPKPQATFEVTREDAGGPRTAPLEYKLPPGVTVKPGKAPATIDFHLVSRRGTE